jgi:hypothetical protein
VQGFVSVVYLLVAVSGYLQFSGNVCGTITESFETLTELRDDDEPEPRPGDGGGGSSGGVPPTSSNSTSPLGRAGSVASTWVTVSQLLVVLSLGAGFPTALWPCRDAICFLLFGGAPKLSQGGEATRACICVVIWACSCGVAMLVTAPGETRFELDEVLELVGATVSSVVAFVLPFMCFTQLRYGIDRGKQLPLPIWRRVLTTLPGLASLLGMMLTAAATYMVARNNLLLLDDGGAAVAAAARDAREAQCERAAAAGLSHGNDGSAS